jgi:hypothetical protein
VPPGRTTPHSYATAKEKKNEKQIIIYWNEPLKDNLEKLDNP